MAKEDLDVFPAAAEAVAWANLLVKMIDAAEQ